MGDVNVTQAGLDQLLERFGLVLTDDPDFDHDQTTFEKAKAAFVAELSAQTPEPATQQPRADVVDALREAVNAAEVFVDGGDLVVLPSFEQWLPKAKTILTALRTQAPASDEVREAMGAALISVVSAVRDYLPPDGISKDAFIDRVIGATDNPRINPIIREIENGGR